MKILRAVLVLSTICCVEVARAQHCAPVAVPTSAARRSASLSVVAATYRTEQYAGSWQGVRPELGASQAGFSGRVWLPAYRLNRNGLEVAGLGDAGVEIRAIAWSAKEPSFALGPVVALTLPTGSAQHDLGMGHVMAMGGVFDSFNWKAWRLGTSVSLARALIRNGSGAPTHHHHGAGPIVEPMNQSEIGGEVLLGVEFSKHATVETTLSVAWPLAISGGERRGAFGFGPVFSIGSLGLRGKIEAPLVGDAFRLRGSLDAEWAF